MKKLLKLLLMSMLVVGVVSAIASSTASALNCVPKAEATTFRVCLFLSATELELLESATFALSQEEGSPHKLEIAFSSPITVSCSEASGVAGVFVETVEGATVSFKGCEVTSANKTECKLESSTISGAEINGSFSLQTELEGSVEGLRLDLLLKPETTGGTFATFTIESVEGHTCIDAQEKGKVKGEQLCYFLESGQEIEEDFVEHLFECLPTGSELTFAGKTATLEAEVSVLMTTPVADNSWSVVQGE